MFGKRVSTSNDFTLTLLRVALGIVFFAFFMNWTGLQNGEGFEYHLLAIALALAILVKGSGAISIDRLLTRTRPPAA